MQPFVAMINPDYSLQDIGTARGRLRNYEDISRILLHSSPVEMLFGHGTASAKQLVLQGDVVLKAGAKEPESINANRVMHNDYLRILYEWGLFGLALFVTMELGILVIGLRIAKYIRSTEALMLVMVIICIFVFYLTVENILAASGAPAGSVIVLSTALLASLRLRKNKCAPLIRH
jgi:O-antigen ligase